jgi:hypothetical protein
MGKLHEVLATEKTVVGASDKLIEETRQKFSKYDHYFVGHLKTLSMIEDSEANRVMAAASKAAKDMPTTVEETLEYTLAHWARAEDVIATKNVTNQGAVADIEFRGTIFAEAVPVDELMGLEARLQVVRGLIQLVPTQDASREWSLDTSSRHKGAYRQNNVERTTKTEKITVPVVLYEATKEHPAQVKEVSRDVVVGTFEQVNWTGAATAKQKAEMMSTIDDLLIEVKKARMRANMIEARKTEIGRKIVNAILAPLKD